MTDINFSLLDTKGLAKPACKLIETVAGFLEPWRTRAQARANADAAVLSAKAKQDALDMEARATRRRQGIEARRQANIEKVIQTAVSQLPEEVSAEPVDEDWVHHFFGQCQDISNEEMQTLWSKLLAGEMAKPGTFSLRTLNATKVLTHKEAALFTKFCTFVWWPDSGMPFALEPNPHDPRTQQFQPPGRDLLTLSCTGLIEYDAQPSFAQTARAYQLTVRNFEKRFVLKSEKGHMNVVQAHTMLTPTGQELARVAGGDPNGEYLAWAVNWWRENGITVTEP
jgi:hypothetical protein